MSLQLQPRSTFQVHGFIYLTNRIAFNQTSVRITLISNAGVKIDPKFNDDYFKRPVEKKNKKTEAEFFEDKEVFDSIFQLFNIISEFKWIFIIIVILTLLQKEEKKKIETGRIEDQKAFDKPIIDAIKKQPNLREYLKAHFTLSKGDFPHRMNF